MKNEKTIGNFKIVSGLDMPNRGEGYKQVFRAMTIGDCAKFEDEREANNFAAAMRSYGKEEGYKPKKFKIEENLYHVFKASDSPTNTKRATKKVAKKATKTEGKTERKKRVVRRKPN